MRSFAIDEPGSPVRALYATLVMTKPTLPIFKSSSDESFFEISATDLSGSIKDSLEISYM